MKRHFNASLALMLALLLFFVPAVRAEETAIDESSLRTLEYIEGDAGLTCLRILMNDGSNRSYALENIPEHLYLETFHDSDAILMDYYINEPAGPIDWEEIPFENHLWLTFKYNDASGAWIMTAATDAGSWTAKIQNGLYTSNDYSRPDDQWQWSVRFEDDLCRLDFPALAFPGKIV